MLNAALHLALLFFQAAPAVKPLIDNDRVIVWDTTAAVPDNLDRVRVLLTGNAIFVKKGAPLKIDGRAIVIGLKDARVAPMANKTSYPLAFPRPGSKKILENDRVIVWDYTWTPGVATPMHFHDKDVVVVYMENGTLQSTTPDGKITPNPYKFADVRFNLRDRTHTETLTTGKQHAIITEFK